MTRVNNRVNSVGRRGNPGDHHGKEKENSNLRVRPDRGVRFHSSVTAGWIKVGIGSIRLVSGGGNRAFAIRGGKWFLGVRPASLKIPRVTMTARIPWRGGDVANVPIRICSCIWLLWVVEAPEIDFIGRANGGFRGHENFGGLNRAEGIAYDWHWVGRWLAEIAELLSLLEDILSCSSIDGDCTKDDDPGQI